MDKSFEEEFKDLENLIKSLEDNDYNLDESIKLFEKAKKLYKNLDEKLSSYQAKVEMIGNDG